MSEIDWIDIDLDALQFSIDSCLAGLASQLSDAARSHVSSHSGDLADSIAVSVEDGHISVTAGNDAVSYAVPVEFGTDDTQAKPFMRPAFDQVMGNAVEEIAANLADDFQNAGRWLNE